MIIVLRSYSTTTIEEPDRLPRTLHSISMCHDWSGNDCPNHIIIPCNGNERLRSLLTKP